MLKELVTVLVEGLVDRPEAVRVEESVGSETIILDISVAKADIGKLLGKHGRNIKAVRTIAQAASGRHKKRVIVGFVE